MRSTIIYNALFVIIRHTGQKGEPGLAGYPGSSGLPGPPGV